MTKVKKLKQKVVVECRPKEEGGMPLSVVRMRYDSPVVKALGLKRKSLIRIKSETETVYRIVHLSSNMKRNNVRLDYDTLLELGHKSHSEAELEFRRCDHPIWNVFFFMDHPDDGIQMAAHTFAWGLAMAFVMDLGINFLYDYLTRAFF